MNLFMNCCYEIFCYGLYIFIEDGIKYPCTLKFHNNARQSLNPNFYYVYHFSEHWKTRHFASTLYSRVSYGHYDKQHYFSRKIN